MAKKNVLANNPLKEKVLKLVRLAVEKQAHQPVVLDIRGLSSLCDYFVICSGETGRQVQAIGDNILEHSREAGFTVHHSEADDAYNWLLIDFFDVVVHIFTDEARKHYNLEYLWREAKAVMSKPKPKNKKLTKKSHLKRSRRK